MNVYMSVTDFSACRMYICQLFRFSWESPSFSSNLPVFQVRAPNLPGNTYDAVKNSRHRKILIISSFLVYFVEGYKAK